MSPTEPSVSDLTVDEGQVEMTKFTPLHDDQPMSNGGIPKTFTVDNLAYIRDHLDELDDDEIVEVSIPVADTNQSSVDQVISILDPPKPPPRSTSIYHLQRLQQQAMLAQLETQGLTASGVSPPGPGPGVYPNVVMREKKGPTGQFNSSLRPQSDIYEVRNALNSHVLTGTKGISAVNGAAPSNQRPMSMYDGNIAAATGRPVKHAISRFSAYEISVS